MLLCHIHIVNYPLYHKREGTHMIRVLKNRALSRCLWFSPRFFKVFALFWWVYVSL